MSCAVCGRPFVVDPDGMFTAEHWPVHPDCIAPESTDATTTNGRDVVVVVTWR